MNNNPESSLITITLHGPVEKKTYSCTVIPWIILKKAVALTNSFGEQGVTENQIDHIAGLVVDAFGNQFTLSDLDKGADIGEMLTVLQYIVARAAAIMQVNPTVLPTAKKSK